MCMFNVQQPLSCMWHHANSCRMTPSAHVLRGRALLRVWEVRMVKAFAARLRRIADRLDPPEPVTLPIGWHIGSTAGGVSSTTTTYTGTGGTVWINGYTGPTI